MVWIVKTLSDGMWRTFKLISLRRHLWIPCNICNVSFIQAPLFTIYWQASCYISRLRTPVHFYSGELIYLQPCQSRWNAWIIKFFSQSVVASVKVAGTCHYCRQSLVRSLPSPFPRLVPTNTTRGLIRDQWDVLSQSKEVQLHWYL